MIELLKQLCRMNGVSGDEEQVREWIRAQARPYADTIRTDALGNLIVFKRGKKPSGSKLLLAAHMDEVGLIVTKITDEGFLKFDFVGGVDRRVAIGKPVVIGPERVSGIIGLKAIHLVSREEEKKTPKTDALYIDIGAKDKESAQKLVSLGDYGSFIGEPEELGRGRQGDGFLCHLPSGGGRKARGDGKGPEHSRPAGHSARRRHRRGRHPHQPYGSADWRHLDPLPVCSHAGGDG